MVLRDHPFTRPGASTRVATAPPQPGERHHARDTVDVYEIRAVACARSPLPKFYSNTNTVLLGLIVEKATGRRYADVLRELILDPLGLVHTSQGASTDLPEPSAHGYTRQGLTDELKDATFWSPTWGFAVGDLISTFEDLRVWARAAGRGELLSEGARRERFRRVTLPPNVPMRAYAFGIGFTGGWWGHGGELPGYNTGVFHRPDVDATLVIVVNNDDDVEIEGRRTGPMYVLANRVIAIAAREAPLGDLPDEVPWEDDSFESPSAVNGA